MQSEGVHRFGILLPPNFSAFSVTCLIEPLRVANRLASKSLYDWKTISLDGQLVTASNGFPLQPDLSIDEPEDFTNVVVCNGGNDGHLFKDRRAIAWLRRFSRHGTRIGAITSGSWILAYAGLLDDRPCTIHWEELTAFRNTFPHLQVTSNLYEVDRSRFTCGGGTAVFDLILHLIAERMGQTFAMHVSEQLSTIESAPLYYADHNNSNSI